MLTPPATLTVLAATPGTCVQDLGRPDAARWGTARSGAADRSALVRANRLAGGDDGAAALECPLAGLAVRAGAATVVAVTGAPCAVTVDGRPAAWDAAVVLPAGAVLRLGPATAGLRTYVAVRGGLAVEPVLGSRSWDVPGRLGPPPPAVGDVLPVGAAVTGRAQFGALPARTPAPGAEPALRVVLGPRPEALEPASLRRLLTAAWTVRADSDRVGVRLDGPALARRLGEVPSEPTLPGAVQVPPDGRPIVLGPDCGATGGYPVVAVVVPADLDALAQVRPGAAVRFTALPTPAP